VLDAGFCTGFSLAKSKIVQKKYRIFIYAKKLEKEKETTDAGFCDKT
jgi:hypothetical protein